MQTPSRAHLSYLSILGAIAALIVVLFQTYLSQAGAAKAGEMALPPSGLTPAVVYTANNGHIHEIVLKGTWQDRDLTTAALAPLPYSIYTPPMAFRRGDGVSMVVYRGKDAHIHALYLEFVWIGNKWEEVWRWADLSAISGSPDAASDPYGYVRSDGVSSVLYTGVDGHIHELRLEGAWIWADLTASAGTPAVLHFAPIGYVRADGINAIVYLASSNGHIIELRLEDGWETADLTNLAGAPLPMSRPSAYVRSDGISTINYAGADYHVHDLRLENGWIWSDLTAITGAPETGGGTPYGYVRSDGVNAIVYATGVPYADHIFELHLSNGWHSYELTSVPGANLGVAPVGHIRADGVSAVVYQSIGAGWRIQEFWLDGAWGWADLSQLAGAPAAISNPWPYNRSVYVANIYLPLIN